MLNVYVFKKKKVWNWEDFEHFLGFYFIVFDTFGHIFILTCPQKCLLLFSL